VGEMLQKGMDLQLLPLAHGADSTSNEKLELEP